MIVSALTILSVAFVARSVSEGNIAKRYVDSTKAFWIVEAGLAQGYHDWLSNSTYSGGTATFAGGSYAVAKTAGLSPVTVTGTVGGVQRTIKAYFVGISSTFNNMLSTGGNLNLNYSGLLGGAIFNVNGNTVYFGEYTKDPRVTANFNPAPRETDNQDEVTIGIPDYDQDGTGDPYGTVDFDDFRLFGRQAVQGYPPNEVIYLTPAAGQTVIIYPNHSAYLGKKVIFVEGPSQGEGDVAIIFDATWTPSQDLTIISTGTINYLEPLNFPGSRLNIIAWEGYNEGSVLLSNHEGVTYSHSDATYVDRYELGFTTGNIIANGNLTFNERWSYETLNYSNRAANGDLPPGFQWLTDTGTPTLMDWQEVP